MAVRSLVVGAGQFAQRIVTEEEQAAGCAPFAPLPSVAPAVEEVARALERVGVLATSPLLDPDRDEMLAAWTHAHHQAAGGDPLVVHFSGHGAQGTDGGLYLAVRDSESASTRLRATSVEVDALLRDVEGGPGGPVLFLLDVCGAGQTLLSQLAHQVSGRSRRAWVIAACAADEFTHGARFSKATTTMLEHLAKGWLDLSPTLEYIPVDILAAEIDRQLARADQEDGRVWQSVVRTPQQEAVLDPPPFFRNPSYAQDAATGFIARTDSALRQFAIESDPGLDLMHFATRATGTNRADSSLFSGRAPQLQRIAAWLETQEPDHERLLVVTGGPGSGKSALLGTTVCVTHPALTPLRRRIVTRVRGFRPVPPAIVLAVHARQLGVRQISESLIRQLAHQTAAGVARRRNNPDTGWQRSAGSTPDWDADNPTEATNRDSAKHLIEMLQKAGPAVVIIDALDEANDPPGVVSKLLLPLSGAGSEDPVPTCRVMVATRPWWDTLPELHRAIVDRPSAVLDIDALSHDDLAHDLAEYLGDLLYPHYPQATTDRIAYRLAYGAQHGAFLIASLYADHLLGEIAAGQALSDGQAASRPPCDITQMFELHMAALARVNPWITHVLAVLGHAQGQGMPLDVIHAAALAIAPAPSDRAFPPTLQDTREALTQAAFYLRTSIDADQRILYRYFHQALAEHTAATVNPETICSALLATVPSTGDGNPDWDRARPYLKRHMAAHASTVKAALDRLLEEPSFLVHADPDLLVPHLPGVTTAGATLNARIYQTTAAHHGRRRNPDARRSFLMLDSAVWGDFALARSLAALPIEHQPATAVPLWTTSRAADLARLHTLVGHTGTVPAVVVTTLEGRTIAITAGSDGQVIIWDLNARQRIRVLVGHNGPVNAIATTTLADGRHVAVTGGSRGEMIVWDLETGEQLHAVAGHQGSVHAIATTTLTNGQILAVTVGRDGQVIMWDLETGEKVRTLVSDNGQVNTVATTTFPDGRRIAITAGRSRLTMVWDLDTGERINTLNMREVYAVTTTTLPDGRLVTITGGSGKRVTVWSSLSNGDKLYVLKGHTERVSSIAATTLHDGRKVAITTGNDGQVIVWDLGSGERLRTFIGHAGYVRSVATATLSDGHNVAVTAGDEGQVIVWDLDTLENAAAQVGDGQQAIPGTDHMSSVRAVAATTLADGQAVAIINGAGHLILRELRSGRHVRALPGHKQETFAVSVFTLPNGHAAAISIGRGRRGVVWDLDSGERVRSFSNNQLNRARSVASAVLASGRTVVVTTSPGGSVVVSDPVTGERLRVLAGPNGSVCAVAATRLRDGRGVAVTTSAKPSIVWDLDTGEKVCTFEGQPGEAYAVAAVRLLNGRTAAITTGRGGRVITWDMQSGEKLVEFVGHRGLVRAVATTTLEGGLAAAITAGDDGKFIMWDVETGQPLHPPVYLPARGFAVAATNDGAVVGYGSEISCLAWNTPRPTS